MELEEVPDELFLEELEKLEEVPDELFREGLEELPYQLHSADPRTSLSLANVPS